VLRDPLLPLAARISERVDETRHGHLPLRTARRGRAQGLPLSARQFAEISAFGEGESTFVIAGDPAKPERLTVTTTGGRPHRGFAPLVCRRHHWVPCPYGKAFPVAEWKGKDIVIAGGGIGLAPLKPIVCHILNHRADYGKLTIVYGARSRAI